MDERVYLSVILVAYNAHETIGRCLRSLAPQLKDPAFDAEVILIDSSTDGTAELVRDQFPWVRLFCYSERQLVGNARNLGAAQARGNILAFTDADCIAEPNWLTALAAAHRTHSDPAIGGVVAHEDTGSLVAWANYFCEYAPWLPQAETQSMVDIPGACYSVKRWAFDKFGPFLEDTYSSDTAFNWRLARAGYHPLFVPAVQVRHVSLYNLQTLLSKKIQHGHYFARVRCTEQKLPLWQRFVLWAGLPMLPFLLFYRRTQLLRRHAAYLGPFLKASFLVWLALAAWSLGEARGYWVGPYTTAHALPAHVAATLTAD